MIKKLLLIESLQKTIERVIHKSLINLIFYKLWVKSSVIRFNEVLELMLQF